MKNKPSFAVVAGAIALALSLIFQGCTTVGTGVVDSNGKTIPPGTVIIAGNTINPETVGRDLAVVAKIGVREALRQDPNSRAYFEASVVVLSTSLDGGVYDPVTLQHSLQTISIKELRDPKITDAVTAALELYAAHVAPMLDKKLDANIYVKPLLRGLRDGIAAGLAN